MPGATINNTVATTSAVILNAGSKLVGGTITSPATWDGTNTGTAFTYAVVYITGAGVQVEGVTLTNVPKVGIGIKDTDQVTIRGCHIVGNYPVGQWTGVETNHFGINSDPSTNGTDLIVADNIIESCVQGVFIGNFGTGVGESATVTGNVFKLCWNHAVYGYGSGYSVAGNAIHRCQIGIALSGSYHAVTGNTLYTGTTGGSDQRDYAGISMREAIGCTVVGNTIRGNAMTAGTIIEFVAITTTVVRDNVCADNTIDVVGGTSNAIVVGNSATTCDNNDVHDNTIRTVGRASLGTISISPSATGFGNKVHDNTIVMLGSSYGIVLTNCDGAIVHDNHIRLEFDSGSAVTLGMVVLTSCNNCNVHDNEFKVSSSWGTNVTLRAIYEVSSVTAIRYTNNVYNLNTTKLAAAVPLFVQTGGAIINEAYAVGAAPALAASPGSMIRRTDGAASSTLYIKESAASLTTWRAI